MHARAIVGTGSAARDCDSRQMISTMARLQDVQDTYFEMPRQGMAAYESFRR
jgi:hypothetical protein